MKIKTFLVSLFLINISIGQVGIVQPIVNNNRNDIMQFIQKVTFAVKTNNKILLQDCFLKTN